MEQQDIHSLSKQELLDALAILSRGFNMYAQTLQKRNQDRSSWQARLGQQAHEKYQRGFWTVFGVLMVLFYMMVFREDGFFTGIFQSFIVCLVIVGLPALCFRIKTKYVADEVNRLLPKSQGWQRVLAVDNQKINQANTNLKRLGTAFNYPAKYLYYGYPSRLYDIVSVGRADDLKEALNALEDDLYHDKMISKADSIYESSHQAEINARAAKNWAIASTIFAASASYNSSRNND